MSQLETMIRESADAGDWVADWEDVLRRSGRSRYRSRRAAALVAVAAVTAVFLLPGIGIGGGLNALLSGSSGPGWELRAPLSRGGDLIGAVSVRSSRLFVGIERKGGRVRWFLPTGRGRIPRPEFRWTLQLTGTATVTSARIVRRGRVVARLCSPCSDGAHGTFTTSRFGLQTIFGKGLVVADTPQGRAHGRLRLQKPQR